MFGGSGGFLGGGYGGYNDNGNGGTDRGGFGGASDQAGFGQGGGSGYGGANFQAQPSIGGPGGFLSSQATQATPAAPGPQRQMRREEQCLMPVTIKMMLKQKDLMHQQGQDGTMMIHDRQVSMLMFVACVESCEQQINQQVYTVTDATGRIVVSKFNNQGEATAPVERGKYVRIYGIMRSWQNECKVTAHHVAEIEKAEEISLHEIEVAHAWLELTGRLQKKAPTPQQQARPPQMQTTYQPPQQSYQPPQQSQQQGYQPPQQQGYQMAQQQAYQPPQQQAYQPPVQQQQQQQSSYQPQQQYQPQPGQQQGYGTGAAPSGSGLGGAHPPTSNGQQMGYGAAPAPAGSGFGGVQAPTTHGQYGGNQQFGQPQVGQPANQFQPQAQQPQQTSFNQQLQQITSPSPYANAQAPGVVH